MRWTLPISAILLAGLASVPQMASAQQSSMFGGGSSMGSSLSAGSRSAFGSSSSGGMGGQGGLAGLSGGSNGFGSSTGGQTGVAQSGGSVGGQARRAGDFVGATTQQMNGRGFVGAQQAAGGQSGQGMQGFGNSGMQGFGGGNLQGRGNYGAQNQQGQYGNGYNQGNMRNGRSSVPIRTELSVNIDIPSDAAQQASSALARRLVDLPAIHWRSSTRVEIQGRTAILRGVVATEHDRDLAERVVRLEASVDQVENQLVVASNRKPSAKTPAATENRAASPAAAGSPKAANAAVPPAELPLVQ
jgi:hypothetical protein